MHFEQPADFIENKMYMSHIYQPLLMRSAVAAGGIATLRQLVIIPAEIVHLFRSKSSTDSLENTPTLTA